MQITHRERILLLISTAFIIINQLGLILALDRPLSSFWRIGVWAACAVMLHVIVSVRMPRRDPYLLPLMLLLSGWGIIIIARLQPAFADRQSIWLIVGSLAVTVVSLLPGDLLWIRRYRYSWLLLGLTLLLITVWLGVNPAGREFNPPRLWLRVLGNIYYQPSELMKIVLVAFMASYLADHWISLRRNQLFTRHYHLPSLSFLIPVLLMWGLSVGMVIWQRDLGTATIFFVVFMLMLYMGSGKPLLLLAGAVLLSIAATVAYFLFDVVALRVDIWLNPWQDAEGRSFQLVQSLMAFAAGGIAGEGIGQGYPTFIPVVHSDFVFAAIAEEWGLVGVIGVLVCLLLVVVRGFRIAMLHHNRPFTSLLASGLSLLIAVQTLLIAAGTLRLIPLTGVTLPFVSYGGSSLLTSFVVVGLLLVLSNKETEYDSRT